MTVVFICDYCGEDIEGCSWVSLRREEPTDRPLAKGTEVGMYHTGECWEAMASGIAMIESIGPTMASRPTISRQAVAARRRKHTKLGEDS
jgi:hypothetical protein